MVSKIGRGRSLSVGEGVKVVFQGQLVTSVLHYPRRTGVKSRTSLPRRRMGTIDPSRRGGKEEKNR